LRGPATYQQVKYGFAPHTKKCDTHISNIAPHLKGNRKWETYGAQDGNYNPQCDQETEDVGFVTAL
jgi:hypothetical protein